MGPNEMAKEVMWHHPWMNFRQAQALMLHAHMEFVEQVGYFGDLQYTSLMKIRFGILLREDRHELENRIARAAEHFGL